MAKGLFICFLGCEGVGKSTQIKLLESWLSSINIRKVKVVDLRGNSLLAYAFWRFLSLSGRYTTFIRPDGTQTVGPDQQILKRTCKLWFLLMVASTLPLIFVKVYVPLFRGYVVIAERYVLDIFSDISRLAHVYGAYNSKIAKLSFIMLRFLPQNSQLIHLYADYSVLKIRYQTRQTPSEWSEYIESRNSYYDLCLRCFSSKEMNISYFFINTTNDNEKLVFQKIKLIVQPKLIIC